MMATNWNLSTSQSGSIMGSGEDSLHLDDLGEQTDGPEGQQLSNVPPLVVVSSRVKHYASLVRLANPGVAVVHYNYETTSLGRLLVLIGDTMKSRQALSIALVVHGQPGNFKINRQNVRTSGLFCLSLCCPSVCQSVKTLSISLSLSFSL